MNDTTPTAVLCSSRHPEYPERYQCNREFGHPGDHCQQQKNDYNHQYENHWWPQKACPHCGSVTHPPGCCAQDGHGG